MHVFNFLKPPLPSMNCINMGTVSINCIILLTEKSVAKLKKMDPRIWCDDAARKAYEELIPAKIKDTVQVSWILSPDLACFICKPDESNEISGINDEMKLLLNDIDNFELADKDEVMRYKSIDDSLKAKGRSGANLTTEEEERAKDQIEFLLNHDEIFPSSFLDAAEKFYTDLVMLDGQKLWPTFLNEVLSNTADSDDNDDDHDEVDAKDPWRSQYQQQRYRHQSSSKYLDKKDCAHIVSLELAHAIADFCNLNLEDKKMKEFLNDFGNFRMVLCHTNRSVHRKIDQSIITKLRNNEALTNKEKSRALQQKNFCQQKSYIYAEFANPASKILKSLIERR